jgi:hypothetical protein
MKIFGIFAMIAEKRMADMLFIQTAKNAGLLMGWE